MKNETTVKGQAMLTSVKAQEANMYTKQENELIIDIKATKIIREQQDSAKVDWKMMSANNVKVKRPETHAADSV